MPLPRLCTICLVNLRSPTIVFIVFQTMAFAAENAQRHTLPDDPDKAWAEVMKVLGALRPPQDWQTTAPKPEQVAEFQKQVRGSAVAFADEAQEFIKRFPANERMGDVRTLVVYALAQAVAAGDADAETRVEKYVSAVLADKSIPEEERAGVLFCSGQIAFVKRVGMRIFTERGSALQEEESAAMLVSIRAALREFPKSSFLHTFLISAAQNSAGERQREIASEVANSPDAPAGAKTLANHILKGTTPYQLGKPLDIQFTALDGREVDLAKLKGKVVLVEFWSTSCPGCVARMPELKATYEKFKPRGFEVIGISLDWHKNDLLRVIKEKEISWPQHFDGKGFESRFAVQYGVFSMPTMWLVDRRGNLRFTDASGALEQLLVTLLDEEVTALAK